MRGQLRIFPFTIKLESFRFENMVLYQLMKRFGEKKKPTDKATGWLL